jgi:hypothetical protein
MVAAAARKWARANARVRTTAWRARRYLLEDGRRDEGLRARCRRGLVRAHRARAAVRRELGPVALVGGRERVGVRLRARVRFCKVRLDARVRTRAAEARLCARDMGGSGQQAGAAAGGGSG